MYVFQVLLQYSFTRMNWKRLIQFNRGKTMNHLYDSVALFSHNHDFNPLGKIWEWELSKNCMSVMETRRQ